MWSKVTSKSGKQGVRFVQKWRKYLHLPCMDAADVYKASARGVHIFHKFYCTLM